MHKKTFETNANKRPAEPYDHLDDTFGNVCSSTECTGLITHAPLTEEELIAALKGIIEKTGATSAKDMGKVMGIATKELAGVAEGKVISAKVKELLG